MSAENEYEMGIQELYKCGGLKFKGLTICITYLILKIRIN